MQKRIVRKDEQIRLIMECRQSGLSDYQWCQRQDINVGTFYNWVSKLRKAGYTFPDSKSKSEGAVVVQDVVKVNLVSEDMSGSVIEQNTRPIATPSTPSVAAELVVGNVTLRLFKTVKTGCSRIRRKAHRQTRCISQLQRWQKPMVWIYTNI